MSDIGSEKIEDQTPDGKKLYPALEATQKVLAASLQELIYKLNITISSKVEDLFTNADYQDLFSNLVEEVISVTESSIILSSNQQRIQIARSLTAYNSFIKDFVYNHGDKAFNELLEDPGLYKREASKWIGFTGKKQEVWVRHIFQCIQKPEEIFRDLDSIIEKGIAGFISEKGYTLDTPIDLFFAHHGSERYYIYFLPIHKYTAQLILNRTLEMEEKSVLQDIRVLSIGNFNNTMIGKFKEVMRITGSNWGEITLRQLKQEFYSDEEMRWDIDRMRGIGSKNVRWLDLLVKSVELYSGG